MTLLNAFADLLTHYFQQAEQLTALLEQEKAALTTEAYETLVATIAEKKVLLENFQQSDAKLADLMLEYNQCHGHPDKSLSVGEFVRELSHSDNLELAQLWERLHQQLDACNKQNRLNGAIISSRLVSIRRALDLIRYGQANSTVAYGEKGQLVSSER